MAQEPRPPSSLNTTRVAFLGTGLMGTPMAANLVAAGFEVTVWNRTCAKAAPLQALGARVADDARAAVVDADLVLSMLDSGPVVEDVFFGKGGAAAVMRAGALVIDCSSIPPALARDHAQRLGAAGVAHIDAPVSGGPAAAKTGRLAIMAGGTPGDFARALPALAKLGRATHVGPSGAGQMAKLCNQVIVAVTIGAVSEALVLAAAGGADPAAVREALSGGFADSRILSVHGQRMLDRDFIPGGLVKNQLKDCDTALDVARTAGLTLPLMERVTELFRSLREHRGDACDHSALLLEIERINGSRRIGTTPDKLPSTPSEP